MTWIFWRGRYMVKPEAKAKKAEEQEKAAKEAEKDKEQEQTKAQSGKVVEIEAASEEELLEKILGIKWE